MEIIEAEAIQVIESIGAKVISRQELAIEGEVGFLLICKQQDLTQLYLDVFLDDEEPDGYFAVLNDYRGKIPINTLSGRFHEIKQSYGTETDLIKLDSV